ncbi:MAG: MarR family winged helix-turn-helix transcriptional regulator [Euzebya sp.]
MEMAVEREDVSHGGVVKDVVRMTFELAGRLWAHMDRCAGELDLTPMQARALFHTHVPVPMHHMAKSLHCDASNITGIVDRLEERGLMARVIDPQDRRRRNLVVTDKGRAVTGELKQLLGQKNPILNLDPGELDVLHGLLQRILDPTQDS